MNEQQTTYPMNSQMAKMVQSRRHTNVSLDYDPNQTDARIKQSIHKSLHFNGYIFKISLRMLFFPSPI